MNFVDKILINWKTTAPGVLLIVLGLCGFAFSIVQGTLTEERSVALVMGILSGVAAVYSRAIGVSTEQENGKKALEDAGEREGK